MHACTRLVRTSICMCTSAYRRVTVAVTRGHRGTMASHSALLGCRCLALGLHASWAVLICCSGTLLPLFFYVSFMQCRRCEGGDLVAEMLAR